MYVTIVLFYQFLYFLPTVAYHKRHALKSLIAVDIRRLKKKISPFNV